MALQQLPTLQQLRVYHPSYLLTWNDHGLVHLASKLVDYEMSMYTSWLTRCVHLTRLVLCEERLPEGIAQALAAMTGLRELGLQYVGDSSVARVVQQAAGMAQLRSLQLVGRSMSQLKVAPHLAQCTQLTSLVLMVKSAVLTEPPGNDGPWVSALQQLTGLRSLTVHEQLLGCEQGTWLAALTQLSSLCVLVKEQAPAGQEVYVRGARWARQLVEQVQPWPAGLQQVTFWVKPNLVGSSFKPKLWAQTAPCGTVVAMWLERQGGVARGWARPLRSCPHLRGVWELQGPAQGRPLHKV
jgi:hypothetical protein